MPKLNTNDVPFILYFDASITMVEFKSSIKGSLFILNISAISLCDNDDLSVFIESQNDFKNPLPLYTSVSIAVVLRTLMFSLEYEFNFSINCIRSACFLYVGP